MIHATDPASSIIIPVAFICRFIQEYTNIQEIGKHVQLAACLDYNATISVNRKCKQMHVSFVSSVEVDSTNHDTMTERWAGDDGLSD